MPYFAYNVGGWVQKEGKMCLRNKSMAPNETINVCLKFAVNLFCSYTVLGSDKVSAGSISGEKSKQMLLKAGLDLHF